MKTYYEYMFGSKYRLLMGKIKHEPVIQIMNWQKAARISDYYKYKIDTGANFYEKIMYLFWIRRRNILAEKLGLEINTIEIGKGFLLYHGGATASGAIMGENCRLHGNNCIGNSGPHDDRCPILGNNVMVGVGAKIIGPVRIADNVKIAAGAVVVKDVLEPGCTVAGVPARIVKHAES